MRIPKYRLQRSSGLALVEVRGKRIYLGRHGTPESRQAYGKIIAQLTADEPPTKEEVAAPVLVKELILDYWHNHVRTYYVKHEKPTSQQTNIRMALRFLRRSAGELPAEQFGPLALSAARDLMVEAGLARTTANKYTRLIRTMFKWAGSRQLVPGRVWQDLATLDGLRMGRSKARETTPVGPVADDIVQATLPHLPPAVAAMVKIQRLCGCRPTEVCMIRPCDVERPPDPAAIGAGQEHDAPAVLSIDRGKPATDRPDWIYRPESHKTEHHGRERRIYLGPRAQEVLRPYLARDPAAYCFNPWERPLGPASPTRRRKPKGKLRPNRQRQPRYDKNTYLRIVARGCELAFKMPAELRKIDPNLPEAERAELRKRAAAWRAEHTWHPNQLRHAMATELRKRFGLEAAQVILGHASANVTQVYAERDFARAAGIMQEVG